MYINVSFNIITLKSKFIIIIKIINYLVLFNLMVNDLRLRLIQFIILKINVYFFNFYFLNFY